jgi:hypothetical protein
MTAHILLLTTVRWPSAGRLAGAFAACGCRVAALLPADHPACRSRYFDRTHIYRPLHPVASLLAAIDQSGPDFIVALDDRATALLLNAQRRAPAHVAALIARALGQPENYAGLMSRSGFIDAARDADIRTPPTRAVKTEADLEDALLEIGFPAVIKADGTWGGDGVAIVRERDEALLAYRKLASPPSLLRSVARAIRHSDAHFLRAAIEVKTPGISVQRFISGKPATTSLACWQGELLAANHFETLAAQETNGPASVLRRFENGEMQSAAARLAQRFRLSGLHGLDYMLDERGNAHLIEINPRSPQTSYLGFGAGHDLVSALVSRIDGTPHPARPHVTGDIVALFPQEWMRNPMSPYLMDAFHDVPWDDPALIHSWMESRAARPALDRWRAVMAENAKAQRLAAQP